MNNISEKLKSQEVRGKFRQGIKCDIDFLNQLNMHNLVKALLDGKRQLNTLPKTIRVKPGDIFECLKDFPLMDVLKLIDNEKAHKFFSR